MRNLTLALLQADLRWQDPAANRAMFEELARELPADVDLLVLPEMFTSGFTMQAERVAEDMGGESLAWLRELAARRRLTITGSLVIRERHRSFNRLIWMPPGGEAGHYDKRHLFRMAGEHEHYSAGGIRPLFRLRDWRVRPLICYDLRFPVWSRGIDEFELLLYVANWPAARHSAWQSLLPARAVENLCYCAGLNRVGTDGEGIAYAGGSGVWDFLGKPVGACGGEAQTLIVELDAGALLRYREKFPAHLDADRFQIEAD